MSKIDCVVLGATGLIGQQFVRILADHPMFNLAGLYASERSADTKIKELWGLPNYDCPESIGNMEIESMDNLERDFTVAFSALPSIVANELEVELREDGKKVFSNASAHRMDKDVPILIPEINGEHLALIDVQQDIHNTDGFIITNSNCSASGSAIYLHELSNIIDIDKVVITTYQAISGAGMNGVSGLDIIGNVIPHIRNEEPKIIAENKKILAELEGSQLIDVDWDIIANAARVGVPDGHLEAITCFTSSPVDQGEVTGRLRNVKSPLDTENYHIAPSTHFMLQEEPDRPQPKLDVFRSEKKSTEGMVVHGGRVRSVNNDISSYVLVHNTIRGGAGGSVLNAEFAVQKGKI